MTGKSRSDGAWRASAMVRPPISPITAARENGCEKTAAPTMRPLGNPMNSWFMMVISVWRTLPSLRSGEMDHGQYAGERQRKAEPEMGVVQDLGGQLGRQSGEVRPSGLFVDDEVDQGRGRHRGNQVTKQGCPAQKGPERQTRCKADNQLFLWQHVLASQLGFTIWVDLASAARHTPSSRDVPLLPSDSGGLLAGARSRNSVNRAGN